MQEWQTEKPMVVKFPNWKKTMIEGFAVIRGYFGFFYSFFVGTENASSRES